MALWVLQCSLVLFLLLSELTGCSLLNISEAVC